MIDQKVNAVLHPTKIRIVEALAGGRRCTTYDLIKELEIPQATMYRNLRPLYEHGIVKVANTAQKRGATEKIIYLANDEEENESEMPDSMVFIRKLSKLVGEHNRKYSETQEIHSNV